MMTKIVQWLSAFAVGLLLSAPVTGCKPKPQTFYVKGVVKELKPDGKTAIIEHEEIPDYMPKMTMPFEVKSPKELAGVQPNDLVHFRLVVTKDDAWIDQVTRAGTAGPSSRTSTSLTNTAPVPHVRLVRDVEPLKVGDAMTDYTFTNEFGKPVRLADMKGKAYAFTFIFTRCPLPMYCPRLSDNFKNVAARLAAQADAPVNWHLFSISFDVEHDSPAVLQNYAKRYNYDPARWSFLTGKVIDIDAITEQFGLYFARTEGNNFVFDHNMRLVIVDAAGKVQSVIVGNEWKPEEVVSELIKGAKAR